MLIQSARFAKLLRKLVTFVGPDPAMELPEAIFAALVLESDRLEFLLSAGTLPFFQRISVAAGAAGTFALVGVLMPLGSGKLAVVEGVIINNATAAPIDVSLDGVAGLGVFTVVQQLSSRDLRTPQIAAAQAISNNTAVGSVGSIGAVIRVPANDFRTIALPPRGIGVVGNLVGPGSVLANNALIVQQLTAAAAVDASFFGYERALEPAEQNP